MKKILIIEDDIVFGRSIGNWPPRDGTGPGKEIPRLGGVRPRPCRPAPAGREQHGAAALDA